MGASARVGTTYLTILLASYMAGVFGKKTAVLEMNRHGDFLSICRKQKKQQRECICFRLRGVDYYPFAAEGTIADCLNQGYECIVMDFGNEYLQGRKEFLRCQKKIVTGSLADWEMERFMDFMKWTQMDNAKDWMYAAFLGDGKNRKQAENVCRISIAKIPFLESPYWIDETVMRFFQEFLK